MTPPPGETPAPLVLGVTGHRILADVERVRAGVARALSHLEQCFPDRPLTIISALSEGADRIVVQEVLKKPGAVLEVVLPMPREDYFRDFSGEKSRREVEDLIGRAASVHELPPCSDREASYEAAGRWVIGRSQVLFAVWDGKPAQGRGGTGAMVALARAGGLPIAWIHAGNRKPGTHVPISLGQAQGSVTFERF